MTGMPARDAAPRQMHAQDAMVAVLAQVQAGRVAEARRMLDAVARNLPDHPIIPLFETLISQAEAAAPRAADAPDPVPQVTVLPVWQNPNRFHDPVLMAYWGGKGPRRSEISDHLGTLFYEAVAARPKLIVELGTGTGSSTRVLLAAARHAGACMLSIDVKDKSALPLPSEARAIWHFERADDAAFARERFADWCRAHALAPAIDVLFIDTSHELEHTRREIAAWFPFLAEAATVVFHDTNLHEAFLRRDGTAMAAYDNDRGVIRAIEEHLGRHYDERTYFVDVVSDWLVRHDPVCNGLLVMRRHGRTAAAGGA
jgi:predicted O-methyltransferase YrrM